MFRYRLQWASSNWTSVVCPALNGRFVINYWPGSPRLTAWHMYDCWWLLPRRSRRPIFCPRNALTPALRGLRSGCGNKLRLKWSHSLPGGVSEAPCSGVVSYHHVGDVTIVFGHLLRDTQCVTGPRGGQGRLLHTLLITFIVLSQWPVTPCLIMLLPSELTQWCVL